MKKKWPELMKDSKVMWEAIDAELSDKYLVSIALSWEEIKSF